MFFDGIRDFLNSRPVLQFANLGNYEGNYSRLSQRKWNRYKYPLALIASQVFSNGSLNSYFMNTISCTAYYSDGYTSSLHFAYNTSAHLLCCGAGENIRGKKPQSYNIIYTQAVFIEAVTLMYIYSTWRWVRLCLRSKTKVLRWGEKSREREEWNYCFEC